MTNRCEENQRIIDFLLFYRKRRFVVLEARDLIFAQKNHSKRFLYTEYKQSPMQIYCDIVFRLQTSNYRKYLFYAKASIVLPMLIQRSHKQIKTS